MTAHLDWPAIQDDAVHLLHALIRFDTTNPPGNELPAAQFLAEALRAAGYEPAVLESAPGRGNVIAPIRLPAGLKFLETIHGHDERIPVDAFREGVRVFAETVLDFCSQ